MSSFFDWIFSSAGQQRGQPAPLRSSDSQYAPEVSGRSPVAERKRVRGFADRQLEPWRVWATQGHAFQRGMPAPLAAADHRPPENIEYRVPYGLPTYKFTRRFDRGSAAFAFDTGRVFYNPIGAGLVFTRPLPVFSSLIGIVLRGQGIFWNNQIVGTSGPELGVLYSPQVLQALLGPTLGAAVVSQNYIPASPSGVQG